MKMIVKVLQSLFKTQRKNLNVFILTDMHRDKQRTKIMSKLDLNLKIYFDTEAHLYHKALQTMYLNLEHFKLFRKRLSAGIIVQKQLSTLIHEKQPKA